MTDDHKFREELNKKIKNGDNFRGFDFSRKFLPGIKFYYRADKDEDLIVPDLTGADFSGAILHNCDFLDGRLQNANFEGADLKGSYLFGADLTNANLMNARMHKCHLYGAILNDACITKVSARESLISACEMKNCQMIASDFSNTSLKDSRMVESNLSGSNFSESYLENTHLSYSRLRKANFTKAVLFKADLGKVDAKYANFRNALLGKYDIDIGQYYGANMGRGDFTGADFRGAELIGVNLHSANLQSANLRGSNLRGAIMNDVKMNENTILLDTNLVRARIKGVDFSHIRLGGVNLFETIIDFDEIPKTLWEEKQGDFMQAWEAYAQLKNNFKSLGDRKGERWASRKERRLRGVCQRLMLEAQKQKAMAK